MPATLVYPEIAERPSKGYPEASAEGRKPGMHPKLSRALFARFELLNSGRFWQIVSGQEQNKN